MFISHRMSIESSLKKPRVGVTRKLTLFYKILVLTNLNNKEQKVPMLMVHMHLINGMINRLQLIKWNVDEVWHHLEGSTKKELCMFHLTSMNKKCVPLI